MSDITTVHTDALAAVLDRPRAATVAALTGLVGAAISLHGLPLFFMAASVPMSALGLGLGLWQRNETAVLMALTGFGLAALGLF